MAGAGAAHADRQRQLANGVVVGLALAGAWTLKHFYSRAGFDELTWVLTPAVRVAERLSGASFELEPHHGWLSRDHLFEVVPACAGVNFLVAGFVSLCVGLVHTCDGHAARARLVLASAVGAWAATVLANATRIALAVRLHDAAPTFGPWSPGALHRAVGIAVYGVFLAVLFAGAARVAGASRELRF